MTRQARIALSLKSEHESAGPAREPRRAVAIAVPFIFWAITLRLGEEEEEAAKPNAAPAKGRRRKKKG